MKLSKYTFDELMAELKKPRKPLMSDVFIKANDAKIAAVMKILDKMAKNRKEMDELNREFDKLFFISAECQSFFKR